MAFPEYSAFFNMGVDPAPLPSEDEDEDRFQSFLTLDQPDHPRPVSRADSQVLPSVHTYIYYIIRLTRAQPVPTQLVVEHGLCPRL